MASIRIPDELQKMNHFFENAGFDAYLVGGAVRDTLREMTASTLSTTTDWDIATNARSEDVMKLFKKVIPTGIEHGTVTVHFMGHHIEVTTFRSEAEYDDARHPSAVNFNVSLGEDLSRRDFTMNAIAADLKTGRIIDPFDGQGDIKKKLIRTVGDPLERFSEDALRPIRAIRFSSQLGYHIEENTYEAIKKVRDTIPRISIERFRDEFERMLMTDKPSIALRLMEDTGILELFIPELTACRDVTQQDDRGYHVFDVLDHSYAAVDASADEGFSLPVRLAALFHDIGKPGARTEQLKSLDPQRPAKLSTIISFHNHDKISVEKTEVILQRLKFSNKMIYDVTHLIRNHMIAYDTSWSDAAVRRFIVRVGVPYLERLFELSLCDMWATKGSKPGELYFTAVREFRDRIQKELDKKTALSLKDLAINGNDLIKAGYKGKQIGEILDELFNKVLENPALNEKGILLELVDVIAKEYVFPYSSEKNID